MKLEDCTTSLFLIALFTPQVYRAIGLLFPFIYGIANKQIPRGIDLTMIQACSVIFEEIFFCLLSCFRHVVTCEYANGALGTALPMEGSKKRRTLVNGHDRTVLR